MDHIRQMQERAARDQLMAEDEQEKLIITYGEALRPILEEVLDRKVREMVDAYEESWKRISEHMHSLPPDPDEYILMSDEEAASLVRIPTSAVRALREAGKTDELQHRLLSHAEAAEMLGCSEPTVKRMVADGRLPEPVQISDRRIGHRLPDILAIMKNKDGS